MTPAAFINPAVIHRTAALTGAEPFRYREGFALPGGTATLPLRFVAAGMMSGVQAAVGGRRARRARAARSAWAARSARSCRTRASARPATGWSNGTGRCWSIADTTGGRKVRVDIDAEGQPGYLTTARMLGEAGLMLAEPGVTPDRSGCLTPATAIGTELARPVRAGPNAVLEWPPEE